MNQVEPQGGTSDKLCLLEEALPKLGPALEQERLGAALKQATATVSTFEGQLAQFEALATAADKLSDYVEHDRQAILDLIDEVEELAAEMEEASTQAELDGIAKGFPNLQARHIPRFHRIISGIIRRYVAKNISSLGTLGRLLVKIGATEVGERLQKLEADASRLDNASALSLPKSLDLIEEQRKSTQAKLTALAKDEEVNSFLMALTRGQSSLTLVTPKVLDWLDGLNARDQFRVLST